MDPNTTLKQLRQLAHELESDIERGALDEGDVQHFVDLFDALDRWLTGGGFLPSGWTVRK